MAGPAAKPRALKVLSGTNQPCRDGGGDAEFDGFDVLDNEADFPSPPDHIGPEGQEVWVKYGPMLVRANVLQVSDLIALEHFCLTYQQMRDHVKFGEPISSVVHTALSKCYTEFGMTPASRSRIKTNAALGKGNKFKQNGRKRKP